MYRDKEGCPLCGDEVDYNGSEGEYLCHTCEREWDWWDLEWFSTEPTPAEIEAQLIKDAIAKLATWNASVLAWQKEHHR